VCWGVFIAWIVRCCDHKRYDVCRSSAYITYRITFSTADFRLPIPPPQVQNDILAGLSYVVIFVLYRQYKLDVFCRECAEPSTLYASALYYSDTFFSSSLTIFKSKPPKCITDCCVWQPSEAVRVLGCTARHMPTLILYLELEHSLWVFGIPVICFLRVLYPLGWN
jgi:hypothetical protein